MADSEVYDEWVRGLFRQTMCGAVLAVGAGAAVPVTQGVDLEGRLVTLALPDTRAVVLVFVATDCPISKRYLPELERMKNVWGARHVRFFSVYPNPGENAVGVRAQQAAFGKHLSALLDPGQSLVRLAGAKITPEAAVFVPERGALREVYRGRIDNRYLDLGHQRPQATRRDLELIIEAAVAGAAVTAPGGRAVGCSIVPLP